ncbi:MAG: radical SAM protein [Ignavibacteria bacterium]|nr:radical SAM protein [Ignavibacteria bacterium]
MRALLRPFGYLVSLLRMLYNYKVHRTPISVNYDITYKCNLDCIHCYFYKNNNKTMVDALSDEEWEQVFIRHKNENVSNVYLTGGEPLLRPKVIDAANRIFGYRNVNIVTNGTMPLPPELKNSFYVSIDGAEAEHDEIRGKGTFARTMKNISGRSKTVILATITRQNFSNIHGLYLAAKSARVKGISFSFYTARKDDTDKLQRDELEQAVNTLRELKRIDPDYILISGKMIETVLSKSHVETCILRKGLVQSYTPAMHLKQPCVFGEGIDCSSCGCTIPVAAHSLMQGDWETYAVVRKLF